MRRDYCCRWTCIPAALLLCTPTLAASASIMHDEGDVVTALLEKSFGEMAAMRVEIESLKAAKLRSDERLAALEVNMCAEEKPVEDFPTSNESSAPRRLQRTGGAGTSRAVHIFTRTLTRSTSTEPPEVGRGRRLQGRKCASASHLEQRNTELHAACCDQPGDDTDLYVLMSGNNLVDF